MKPCNNPNCRTDFYDPDQDGPGESNFCPECFWTTFSCCGGCCYLEDKCPYCQNNGYMNCIYDDTGLHCLGCPFKKECSWYGESRDTLAIETYEDQQIAFALEK